MVRQAPLQEIPVQYVKGVGPARARQLARLGIDTVQDLLLSPPRRYEDRRTFVSVSQLIPGRLATVRGEVLAKSIRRIHGGRALVQVAVGDATGAIECVWFNQPYLAQQLKVGDELILYGRVEPSGRRLQLVHPELERLETQTAAEEQADEAAIHMGRIVPIYPLTSGLGQRWYRRMVHTAVNRYADQMTEVLPDELRRRQQLQPCVWAVRQLHFPDSGDTLEAARRRLVFEELFLMQVRLALRRAKLTGRTKSQCYIPDGPLTKALARRLPFQLTASQREALDEMVSDLCQPRPMLRLLQGDVGCGKTVVAASLMAVVVQSGAQVALMAPTELLAQQHARILGGYFEPLGVAVRLLSHQVSAAARAPLLRQVAAGSVGIVVGTHALLQPAVTFAKLGLVVIDEQHKFGVAQRTALVRKGAMPDVLVMTATPIPRTLALSLYGDLMCSTITELPPGRQPVRTLRYPEAERPVVYDLIREALRQGRQGYVVYPLVDAADRPGLKAATQMARHLQESVFPEFRVGLLHGQMRAAQQETVMQAFVEGRMPLMVSTVIVEVGLDVPNATIMLIEHPERFGLAQLHQLRGRVGRGTQPATCLVVTDTVDESVQQRLAAFVETTDGFRLAERDLALRGPGELLGRRQHGWQPFRIADLAKDQDLLELARQGAFTLVARDADLRAAECVGLRQRLRK